jgi:serine/threonine protein kinase
LRTTDERSDIYSLGATMHFLLVGRTMYRANTVVKRILAHRDVPVPSPRAARPEIPEAVDALFQRMVAKRPEDRPRSMTEVMTQLEGCLARLGQKPDTSALGDPFGLGRAKTEESLEPSPVASLLDEWLLEEPTPSMGPVMMPFSFGFRRKTRRRILIGLALAGLALASWMVSTLLVRSMSSQGRQITEGILVVEPSEPGAKVQVFDEEDSLEIALVAETSPVSILVPPGKHRLSVEKAGFQPFRRPFTAGSGIRLTIPARLEPVPPQ